MAFDKRTQVQIDKDNIKYGQQMQDIQSLFAETKGKEKRELIKRVKRFLKGRPKVRVIIKPNQIMIQDIKE